MNKRNNQRNTSKMDMPFLEKFMVAPDNYEIFKFGGTSLTCGKYMSATSKIVNNLPRNCII
ncbi:MAG: hypothetical protein K1W24_04225 [Lachnospiraceae bacterium]